VFVVESGATEKGVLGDSADAEVSTGGGACTLAGIGVDEGLAIDDASESGVALDVIGTRPSEAADTCSVVDGVSTGKEDITWYSPI